MFCDWRKKAAPRPGFRGFRRFTGFRRGWWRLTPQILKKRGAAGAAGCVEGLHRFRSGGDSTCGAEDGGGALRAQIIKKASPHPPSFRPKRSGVEKSPSSDCTGGITAGDLSTQSIMGAVPVYLPYRYVPPLEMTKEPCLDRIKKAPPAGRLCL